MRLSAYGWARYGECGDCGALPGTACVFIGSTTRPRKVPCADRPVRRLPYTPSNPNLTRLARIVIQVMDLEGHQPRDLAILAGQSRQWTYRVLNEQDRKMTQRQAEHLLRSMGYQLQYRAVPVDSTSGPGVPDAPAGRTVRVHNSLI